MIITFQSNQQQTTCNPFTPIYYPVQNGIEKGGEKKYEKVKPFAIQFSARAIVLISSIDEISGPLTPESSPVLEWAVEAEHMSVQVSPLIALVSPRYPLSFPTEPHRKK